MEHHHTGNAFRTLHANPGLCSYSADRFGQKKILLPYRDSWSVCHVTPYRWLPFYFSSSSRTLNIEKIPHLSRISWGQFQSRVGNRTKWGSSTRGDFYCRCMQKGKTAWVTTSVMGYVREIALCPLSCLWIVSASLFSHFPIRLPSANTKRWCLEVPYYLAER